MPIHVDHEEESPEEPFVITHDLEEALEELDEALPAYRNAEVYFEGEAEEKVISPTLRKLLMGSQTEFKVNFAGRVVTAVTDNLEISALTADEPVVTDDEDNQTTPVTGDKENEATQVLNELFWNRNELDIEAPEIHEKAVSLGDAYLLVWESDDGEGVDVFYNSPTTTRVIYDSENPRKKRLGIKRWEIGSKTNKKVRVNLYYPDFIIKLISKPNTRSAKATDFMPFVDDFTDENGMIENPYGEIPLFHFRTARPYGRPEHKQAYGAQDAVTKLTNNQMSASDFSAFPQRWALQETGTATDDDLDWGDTEDESRDPDDHQSQMISGPGRVWDLKNVKAVGQFASSDVEQFLKPLNWYTEAMAAVTGTPLSYFQQMVGAQGTASSGQSKKQDRAALTNKLKARKRSFSATWREAGEFAMRILGFDVEVTVHWDTEDTVSGKEGWEGVRAQQDAGVPVRQTLLEANYTVAQVEEWGYTEDNPDGPGVDASQFETELPPLPNNGAAAPPPAEPTLPTPPTETPES